MSDIKETLKRYAELKIVEKTAKAEMEKLNPEIKEYILSIGADKLPTTAGVFSLSEVSVWKYSSAVEEAEEAVEKLKAEEKATGIAKATMRQDLKFTAPKAPKENGS